MVYFYQAGKEHTTALILLHGTGGDEKSLLSIGSFLAPEATVLSFAGPVKEEGMRRFFKRHGLNQFDLDSLEENTDLLLAEIVRIAAEKKIPLEDWVLVGYSNGANIAAHLLLERATPFKKAILFHPMSLKRHTQKFLLTEKKIWLSKGAADPIVSSESYQELVTVFQKRQGRVREFLTPTGHEITYEELVSAKDWLEKA